VTGGRLTVEIADNGRGLPATLDHKSGTANIQERAALLDGTAVWSSQPGRGTRLTWSVPLPTGATSVAAH
jgi:signal transduction histidine kinase